MRTIWLVRHGLPEFPEGERLCIGCRTNYPLSETGKKQAAAVAPFFEGKPIDNYYTSPLSRAVQTAIEFIPETAELNILEDAHEMDLGAWEGMSFTDICAKYPDMLRAAGIDPAQGFKIPEGAGIGPTSRPQEAANVRHMVECSILPDDAEYPEDAAQRMIGAIRQTKGNAVIACHAAVIGFTVCKLKGMPFTEYMTVNIPYCSVTQIEEADDGTLSVAAWGTVPEDVAPLL